MPETPTEHPGTPVTFETKGEFIHLTLPHPITYIKMNIKEAMEFKKMLERCIETLIKKSHP